jgi:hypothetical protein
MKNFLPLIIIILVVILFAILAFQSSKIIEGNTNASSSTDGACEYGAWVGSACENGEIQQTRNVTSGGDTCSDTTRTMNCADSSNTADLTTSCVRPTNTPGYSFTDANENLSMNSFEIAGLKCADEYYGTPSVNACTVANTPYTLNGCNYIRIEATNADPTILTVNFSKEIRPNAQRTFADFKNNFQYKMPLQDIDFKNVSEVIHVNNRKIKLKLDREIKQDQTILVRYKQNKTIGKGGTEIFIDDVKLENIDEISVINNIVDKLPPKLHFAVVEDKDHSKVILLFNETLKSDTKVDKNNFDITLNSDISTKPNRVEIDGKNIILYLKRKVSKGQVVTFDYKQSSIKGNNIEDINGNSVLDMNGINSINNVGYPHRDNTQSPDDSVSNNSNGNTGVFSDTTVRSRYGPKEESYFNEQYIKSIGAHNPFNFINEKNDIKCRIDPKNKNRAICDLGRNQPVKHFNLDELRDNRGDEKDKYILKTKIIPTVNTRCPTCGDEDEGDDDKSGDPLALNKSVKKLLNIQDNLTLDKFVRTIKTSPNLEINSDLKKNLPNINMPEINVQGLSSFNAPQNKTSKFKNKLDNGQLTNIPQLNQNLMSGINNTINNTVESAKVVNVDQRFANENTPTQLTHEMANIKTNNPSNGFIPRLTSFSAF